VSLPAFLFADRARAQQFSVLGDGRRCLSGMDQWVDADGVAWLLRRHDNFACAVTWLGPGWVFDPYATTRWGEDLKVRQDRMNSANVAEHACELNKVIRLVRLGGRTERLLWCIHQQVVRTCSSVIRPPDLMLGQMLWGANRSRWPRQWRQDLADILGGLTWLHLCSAMEDRPPAFGPTTVLLTHVADLRGTDDDRCDEHCPGRHEPQHHHYLINVGRGFLGSLEQFAVDDTERGLRTYRFPISGPRNSGPTLRRLGKTGNLVTIYLPAKLGDSDACNNYSRDQHRLLQAVVRETTRTRRPRGRRSSETEVMTGNLVPRGSGRGRIICSHLDQDGAYVGFNGNGVRRGLGYYLCTPGGWLAKAGYAPDQVVRFLSDLAGLAESLGLTAVGFAKSSNVCYSLSQLQAIVVATRPTLERQLMRIFTRADYVERWNALFKWEEVTSWPSQEGSSQVVAIASEMLAKRISRRALADAIGTDRSFLSKLFKGRKPWPPALLAKAQAWVGGGRCDIETVAASPVLTPWPSCPGGDGSSLLSVALGYLEQGWSVVPQCPGEKKPSIKWKPYQDAPPTAADWASWARNWPDAGLAVALGPVSNLFVIDVDGPEGHEALLAHLGTEPVAPKALSGSRRPFRYHLFFRHPSVPTKATATPWHAKLEFRGKGGIVVIPPSLHKSGQHYAWAPGQSPADLPFPPVPEQIIAALQVRNRRRRPPSFSAASATVSLPDGIDASPSTRRFLSGAYADAPKWNDRLFRAACDLAGRNMPLEVAEPLLLKGAQPWDATEEDKALATIASAFAEAREPGRC